MTLQDSNKLSRLCFYTGFIMVAILAATFLTTSISFFLNITLGGWQFPIGSLLAGSISYYYLKYEEKETSLRIYTIFGISAGLILVFVALSSYFYDTSFDGQAYHMEAMIQMKNGWNPFYEYLPASVNQSIWVNHYAKGMEIVSAAINCTFDNIEAGKAANFMLWASSFFFTLSFVIRNHWVPMTKGILLSLIIACNPIVLNQLLTYYVDGPMGALLLSLIILGLYILQTPRNIYFLTLALIIFFLVNVKFTAILYIALFAGGYLIWALWHKKNAIAKRLWWVSFVAGLIAVISGFNPYITNTVNFGHPLYPLMGKNKVDIIYAINLPASFEHKNGLERFVISLFSRTDNIYPKSPYPIDIKIPFTFNKVDLAHASMTDARLGGFGPMFSGILLLSSVLAIILYRVAGKEKFIKQMSWLLAFIIMSVIIMPESWWSRYIPQFWLFPLIILLAAEVYLTEKYQIMNKLLYAALLVNLIFCLSGFFFNLLLTTKINYQLAVMKSASQTILVDLGESKSNRTRFSEHNIPFKMVKFHNTGVNEEYIAGSQACFIRPSQSAGHPIEEPWILRIAGKFLPFMWQYYGR